MSSLDEWVSSVVDVNCYVSLGDLRKCLDYHE